MRRPSKRRRESRPAKKKPLEKVVGAEDATVADFAERFFKDIQLCDRKNVTMPRRYLKKDILPHIGSKPVRDITAEDVRSVIWRKKEHKASIPPPAKYAACSSGCSTTR